MYNLNVNLATTAANAVNSLLAVENGSTTPRTPEILNSLIAMTSPLDNYNFGDDAPKLHSNGQFASLSSDSNSSSCSQLESPTNGPKSVQHTCSQLIKAGLKLSIEQKRKLQSDGEDLLDLDKCSKRIKKNECSESEEDKANTTGKCQMNWHNSFDHVQPSRWSMSDGDERLQLAFNGPDDVSGELFSRCKLTPEDEERRRRRRERNKIAATKCRLKKRERTANLVTESETLETQNIELKSQIQELQTQRRQLMDMLAMHKPTCQKNIQPVTREAIFNHRLPPVSSVIDNNHSHSYNRPASVDVSYRTQTLELYNRPASVGNELTYSRTTIHYAKPPSIIIDPPSEMYQPQLTNLDNTGQNHPYHNYSTNQQCHNYTSNQSYGNPGMDNGCMA